MQRRLPDERDAERESEKAAGEVQSGAGAAGAAGEALRDRDAFRSRFIESSEDCIKVLDLEGRLVAMNARGMGALEICDLEPLLGSSWMDFWQGADREAACAAVAAARAGRVGKLVGFFPTVQTRQPRWWHVVVTPILDEDGNPEKLLAVSRDITEWKRADELLRALTATTATLMGSGFFGSLAEQLASMLGARAAYIAEALPSGHARSLGFSSDGAPGPQFEYALAGAPCAEVNEGRTRFHPARLPVSFPAYRPPVAFAPQSYLGVPLFDASRRVIGLLVALGDGAMEADPLLIEVVETFAARAGAELERARAERRERAVLEVNNAIISSLTQETLLRAMSQALSRVIRFDRAALTLHDPKANLLRILALEGPLPPRSYAVGVGLDVEDSHVGWCFRNQRTLLRRNLEKEREFGPEHGLYAEGVRSLCTAPLILAGKSIGTITVGSLTPDQFSELDEAFLRDVSSQVALAISNVAAFEQIAELKARLQAENLYLKEEIRGEHDHSELVGNSPVLLELQRQVEQVAPTDSTVLIVGETGTGKELIARAVHDRSARRDRPLVKVNCGAISAGLVESELFGHVRGAFTGALQNRDGRFKVADRGTIFLDEVSELPLEAQVKLLRVLQEQEFEPVGSSRTVKVDVRVIAACNRDLSAAVAAGRFRSDLYYRLHVVPMRVPALRERGGDIELLAKLFLQRFARRFGKPVKAIPDEVMERLRRYAWPGNIRELQNVIERAVVLSQGEAVALAADWLPARAPPAPTSVTPPPWSAGAPRPPDPPESGALTDVERRHIEAVLLQTNWTIEGDRGAARVLDLHPNTLRSRMRKLGIRRPHRSAPAE